MKTYERVAEMLEPIRPDLLEAVKGCQFKRRKILFPVLLDGADNTDTIESLNYDVSARRFTHATIGTRRKGKTSKDFDYIEIIEMPLDSNDWSIA